MQKGPLFHMTLRGWCASLVHNSNHSYYSSIAACITVNEIVSQNNIAKLCIGVCCR